MRKFVDGALMLLIQVAFGLCLAGACLLLNDNTKGWLFEGVALIMAVPVVILLNREEKEHEST